MQRIMVSRGASDVSEVVAILAAGFLRARLRTKSEARTNAGNAPPGLDVFKDVSVHCDRPVIPELTVR